MSERSNKSETQVNYCADWADIVRCLEGFPSPEVAFVESDVVKTNWIFRGQADSRFKLEPGIERQAGEKTLSWPALEKLVVQDFKSHAGMHLSADLIPDPLDDLTWLAQMQHYAIPTRLLDFTHSPFVALYFAIRGQEYSKDVSHVRLWAIDAARVNEEFRRVAYQARRKADERAGKKGFSSVSFNPDDFMTQGDSVDLETQRLPELIIKSMRATGTTRRELEKQGCVAVASPPAFNPRLASQQGVFMVNCGERLRFSESLWKMMESVDSEWFKLFDIAVAAAPVVEQRLFQMNIHEQSLFPDMEGLAGFLRQKIRLHWK